MNAFQYAVAMWDTLDDIHFRQTALMKRYCAVYGLNLMQIKLLICIFVEGPKSLKEFAETSRTSTATLSRTSAGLEKKGLVRRTRDEKDNRRLIIELSSQGTKLVGRMYETLEMPLRIFEDLYGRGESERVLQSCVAYSKMLMKRLAELDAVRHRTAEKPSEQSVPRARSSRRER